VRGGRAITATALALGFLAAVAAHPEAKGTPISPPRPDGPVAPAAYGWLLDHFLVVKELPGGGTASAFDYADLLAQPDQAQVRRHVRDRFEAVDVGSLEPAARTAWAINAYNFFVIDAVLDHFRTASGDTLKSISDIGAEPFSVFDRPLIPVAGTTYSLNGFETHFLFHDIDRKSGAVPAGLDPRIHFALVCAARGCPPLGAEPHRAETLDDQLTAAVKNALRSPRQLRLEADTLHVSKLFDWYGVDFGGPAGIRAFLLRYAPETAREALARGKIAAVVPDIPWDWSLNRPR
jgi:hypothetical protein